MSIDKYVTRWTEGWRRILIQLASCKVTSTFGIIFNSVHPCTLFSYMSKRIWFIRVLLFDSMKSCSTYEFIQFAIWSDLWFLIWSNQVILEWTHVFWTRYTIFSIVFCPFVLSYEYLEENVAPLIKFILLLSMFECRQKGRSINGTKLWIDF